MKIEPNQVMAINKQKYSNLSNEITDNQNIINLALANKVNIAAGMGLSSNDYTSAEKTKVAIINNTGDGLKYLNNAGAYGYIIEGHNNIVQSTDSHVEGNSNVASTDYSHVEGQYNLASNGTLYNITGFNATNKTITLNTVTGLTTGKLLQIKINSSVAILDVPITAINGLTVTLNTTQTITSNWAKAILENTTMSPVHVEGYNNIASGTLSHAEGYGTGASVYASHVQGQYNKALTGTATAYSSTADAFVIGNGTSSSALGNAFRVTFAGKIYGLSAFNSTGADYAEYFEWLDDNPDKEDRVGYFVTLKGEKIRKANSTDSYIIGIVSSAPSVIGDSYQDDWNYKYITDEWDRIQYEYVDMPEVTDTVHHEAEYDTQNADGSETKTLVKDAYDETIVLSSARKDYVPQLNPLWDATKEYIPREQRPEWSAVGLVGKLLVRDDGTCVIDGYCKSNDDGIATAATEGYKIVARMSSNIIKIIVK